MTRLGHDNSASYAVSYSDSGVFSINSEDALSQRSITSIGLNSEACARRSNMCTVMARDSERRLGVKRLRMILLCSHVHKNGHGTICQNIDEVKERTGNPIVVEEILHV